MFSNKPYRLIPLFLLLYVLLTHDVVAQNLLSWEDARAQMLQYHPLAQQADLVSRRTQLELLSAKGGFDLKAFAESEGKNFKENNYFQYTEAGLKLPSWYGLELKGSYHYASGVYLNPESKLPDNGQAQLGLNWNIGQGLLIDERRAALFKARIGSEMGYWERKALLNQLLYEGAKSYWTWVAADNCVSVYAAAMDQALMRHEGLVESFRQGDKSAVDTLETFIQVQNRILDLQQAQLEASQLAVELSNFLWNEQNTPMRPDALGAAPEMAFPLTTSTADLGGNFSNLAQNAPELQLYSGKIRQMEIDQRLKKEQRKPEVELSYALLGSGWQLFPSTQSTGLDYISKDIKWGLRFAWPIPNRKAVAQYQLSQIKIDQTELAQQQKLLEIENKIRQYVLQLQTLESQINLYLNITANYKTLLDAEKERFSYGESSIFLVNVREQRWLDARIKLIKLLSEQQKANAALQWAKGTLAD